MLSQEILIKKITQIFSRFDLQ